MPLSHLVVRFFHSWHLVFNAIFRHNLDKEALQRNFTLAALSSLNMNTKYHQSIANSELLSYPSLITLFVLTPHAIATLA